MHNPFAPTPITDRLIGNAFPVVREVHDNLPKLLYLSENVDALTEQARSAVTQSSAAISAEAKTRTDADSALSTRIDTVSASAAANTSAISTETKARADADSALSSRVDTVVASTVSNTAAITAAVLAEQQARQTEDGNLSSRITSATDSISGLQSEVLASGHPVTDYPALRAYTGSASRVYVTGATLAKPAGIAGGFQHDPTDTTSADDGGTVIVGEDGRRWKRDGGGALRPEFFGAVGRGLTDDTAAVMACFSVANQNLTISAVRLDGVYLCDFTATETSSKCLATITRDGLTISGGTIKVKAGDYTAGVANGSIKTYVLFYIAGNNNTVEGVTFDVNDQSTNYVHSESLPNVEFRHTYMSGTSGSFKHGNKVLKNYYLRGNGQPYVGNYQEHGDITGNYAEGSIGMGWNASKNCSLDRNKSVSARDAHFGIWLSDRITANGNIADGNSNGNGFDVSGSSNVTVVGGVISGNQNCGIWVGKDPNVGTKSSNVLISGVTLRDNQHYASGSDAEIIIANVVYDSSSGVSADSVLVTGNTIVGDKRAVFVGSESKNVKILNNALEPLNTGTPFPSSRIDVTTTGAVVVEGNATTTVAPDTWNDTVLYAGSVMTYCDPAKRNYFRAPNGSVVAGGAGRYNDIINLASTNTSIGRILMTDPSGQSVVKVKIGISYRDLVNYREQEMIFLGGSSGTPIQDSTVRSFVGTSAATGWNSTITAVPGAGGVVDFYATTPVAKRGYIDYEISGEYVTFIKVYNQ